MPVMQTSENINMRLAVLPYFGGDVGSESLTVLPKPMTVHSFPSTMLRTSSYP